MLADFYEFTMAAGYLKNGVNDTVCYFDMFFRNIPDGGGFAVMAGLEQFIEYLENLSFTEDDIDFLKNQGIFGDDFLNYLRGFEFDCDIWAVPEGTPIFPNEPVITVRGKAFQAQLIETMALLCINHQSLIATKANRIARAAEGRLIMEFGSRRAQGFDGAHYGARAAYIGGADGTSCTLAGKEFGIPVMGTMAHSWVQMFASELEAFRAYAECYPDNVILLVDTYNVLKSGLPNAIAVFREMRGKGLKPAGIRIDSGDITYLSKRARKALDSEGFSEVKIIASNSLDEYIIRDLLIQGAKTDGFGVGERLITSRSEPVFGGVYKLAAVEDSDGGIIPKIKISENASKITTPDFKQVYRLFDRDTNSAVADLITCHDEIIDESAPLEIFDPDFTYKRKTVENFEAKPLLERIFNKGKCVYRRPNACEIKEYCEKSINTIWDEVKRFENPHKYYVDLSQKLWDKKYALLKGIY
jgi:nicotinate phosphoribosyltransferase